MRDFIAIDPGDRWNGWAWLDVPDRRSLRMQCGVFDGQTRELHQLVDDLLTPSAKLVSVERFQLRGQGHQHMRAPITAQVIGAIKYVAKTKGGDWTEEPASSPDDVFKYPLGALLKPWRKTWIDARKVQWQHAVSALRILSCSLTRLEPYLMQRMLREVEVTVLTTQSYGYRNDLYSSEIEWVFR